MHLIAHRGLTNNNIRENTLKAFKNALNNNYDGIELDLRKTKDNIIVVLHDKYINRTSNGVGNINKITYKEALKYNFGTKNNKSKIPTLKEVIKNISNTNIFIELKESVDKEELNNILKLNKTNKYYIMSFNKKYIDNLIGIEYNLGLINYVFNSMIDYSNYKFILILEDLFNKDIYDYFNNINLEVVIYNIRNNISLKNKELFNNIKYIV